MSPLTIVFIIMFIVLLFMLLRYLFTDKYALLGMQDGKTMSTIAATDLATNGSNVPSSNFAYSIWFYINDWNYRYGQPKVIFGRMGGSGNSNTQVVPGINGVDPCPVVVLGPVSNNLNISLACFPGIDVNTKANQQNNLGPKKSVIHNCSVANVPIQKWVHLTVSIYGRTMDVYIDGKLVKTCLLPGIANINNNASVYVTPNGGFNGWTSNFQYFPQSLNPQEVYNLYVKGYGGSLFSNLFGSYGLQVSVLENGVEQTTITI
jgi:hypothetical protein